MHSCARRVLSIIMYAAGVRVGELVREARQADGVSQAVLARRAATAQSAISSYENGRIVPEFDTLCRLVGVAGFEVQLTLVRSISPLTRIMAARTAIRELADRHGLSNVAVFGSVARGDCTAGSDIDLLVDAPKSVSLFTTMGFAADVEELLGDGRTVDVSLSRNLDRPVPEAIVL